MKVNLVVLQPKLVYVIFGEIFALIFLQGKWKKTLEKHAYPNIFVSSIATRNLRYKISIQSHTC